MTTMDPEGPLVPKPGQGMSGWQVLAMLCAIVLLFPGLCFTGFGVGFLSDGAAGMPELGLLLGGIGIAIFAVVWLLFRVAFRKRPPAFQVPQDDSR